MRGTWGYHLLLPHMPQLRQPFRIIFDTHLTLTKQWVAKSLGLGETSQATASGLGLGESFILDMGVCLLTCSCVLVVVCVVVCLLGVVGGGFVVVVWLSSSFRSCTRSFSGAELRRPSMSMRIDCTKLVALYRAGYIPFTWMGICVRSTINFIARAYLPLCMLRAARISRTWRVKAPRWLKTRVTDTRRPSLIQKY